MWGTKGLPTYGLGALPVVESINQGCRHTLKIYNTYCLATATSVTPTPLNFTLYAHCLSCYVVNLDAVYINVLRVMQSVLLFCITILINKLDYGVQF
jgi:hypothetical protein